jgi:hypothetical protein
MLSGPWTLEIVLLSLSLIVVVAVRSIVLLYFVPLLYPELRSDDRMPAGRSEAGYRKKVPDNNKMTGRPREDASSTRMSYRVSVAIWPIERRG